jgi:ABC-type branched-subunit amino acid transport system ATPase component
LTALCFLLGPNGTGKTAVLQALARMFGLDPASRYGAMKATRARQANARDRAQLAITLSRDGVSCWGRGDHTMRRGLEGSTSTAPEAARARAAAHAKVFATVRIQPPRGLPQGLPHGANQ